MLPARCCRVPAIVLSLALPREGKQRLTLFQRLQNLQVCELSPSFLSVFQECLRYETDGFPDRINILLRRKHLFPLFFFFFFNISLVRTVFILIQTQNIFSTHSVPELKTKRNKAKRNKPSDQLSALLRGS